MPKTTISKEQFHRYVRLQRSGVVNMYDYPYVAIKCLMEEEQVKEIYRDGVYETLMAMHGDPDA